MKREENMPPELDGDAAVVEGPATVDSEVGDERVFDELLLVHRHPPCTPRSLLHSPRARERDRERGEEKGAL